MVQLKRCPKEGFCDSTWCIKKDEIEFEGKEENIFYQKRKKQSRGNESNNWIKLLLMDYNHIKH